MHIGFLIPLALGLTSGYVSKKCCDEMAYLTVSIAFVSLIISLVIAPWQVQLLLLVFVFLSSNKILHQQELRALNNIHKPLKENNNNQHKSSSYESQQTPTQTLRKYGGANRPALDISVQKEETQLVKKYRGLPWGNNELKESKEREIDTNFQLQKLASTKRNLVEDKANQDENNPQLAIRFPWFHERRMTL
jgi:hypothetical protein